MDRLHRWRVKVAIVVATGGMVLSSFAVISAGSGVASAGPPGAVAQTPSSGYIGAGKIVNAASSAAPIAPTRAQIAAREAAMKVQSGLPTAPLGKHTSAADVSTTNPGPETVMTQPQAGAPLVPNDFQVFKDTKIPGVCVGCAQSPINEPTTANAGKVIVQTSNWNIAYTTNGGAATPTWQYQDPYALSAAFCCDQEVLYEPSRDRFVYTGLTTGTGTQVGFTIATTKSTTPTAWCTYHFNSGNFGGTAGELLDYQKISYGGNNIYVTWNRYDATGSSWLGTGLARLPSDALSSCAGFSYLYTNRTDNFTFGLTRGGGSTDTFYWVSNWYNGGPTSGSNLRIYYWPENSNSYSYVDRGINAYTFSGGNCGSTDGVVANWCSRLDPRWLSPWISYANPADPVLGVAISAGASGFSNGFPYVVYERFHLSSLSYIGSDQTYSTDFAFAYPGCTANVHGYVGCAMSWGGGRGTGPDYYPGGFLLQQDNVSPSQPWDYRFQLFGAGNATRWGDYDVTLPFSPAVGPFISTIWAVSGGVVVPHVVIFGRNHDLGGYARWKSK